jgi:hypothetical protein
MPPGKDEPPRYNSEICCGAAGKEDCIGPKVIKVMRRDSKSCHVASGCFSEIAKTVRRMHLDDVQWLIDHGATWLEIY